MERNRRSYHRTRYHDANRLRAAKRLSSLLLRRQPPRPPLHCTSTFASLRNYTARYKDKLPAVENISNIFILLFIILFLYIIHMSSHIVRLIFFQFYILLFLKVVTHIPKNRFYHFFLLRLSLSYS